MGHWADDVDWDYPKKVREEIRKEREAERSAQEGGIALITAERRRQIESEGWTPEHDDGHKDGQLAMAAACYAAPLPVFVRVPLHDGPLYRDPWPWSARWDKRPRDERLELRTPTRDERRRMLAKAGALIAAELDRMAREDAQGDDNGR